MKTIVIALFALTYILMLSVPKYRHFTALTVAGIYVVMGVVAAPEALAAVDWNVILMLAGTMGTVYLCIESQMPAAVADILVNKLKKVKLIFVALALFSGFVSAFIDNVATVLMIAPVALAFCKKLKVSPVPAIICIAVSSNLQGAATLVGDTTAIMLGSYANMNFLDFFLYQGKPGIFFAVELGAIISALLLAWLFRKKKAPVNTDGCRTEVTDYVPTILLVGTIILLIAASFIPNKPDITNGLICVILLAIGVICVCIKTKRLSSVVGPMKAIDFETIGLLLGLFLIIGGIANMGVIDAAAGLLAKLGGGNVFLLYTVIVWASVLLSAFIDNIPYVATMLPVITGLAKTLGVDPTLLYFGLLSGATLGGNCTPIGASANIAGIGILRKEGYDVKTKDFLRIGIPFTLAAVIPAYIYFWVLYR